LIFQESIKAISGNQDRSYVQKDSQRFRSSRPGGFTHHAENQVPLPELCPPLLLLYPPQYSDYYFRKQPEKEAAEQKEVWLLIFSSNFAPLLLS
jgi:hypothetical protein